MAHPAAASRQTRAVTRRVAVVGCSGSGKTTLARALAARLGVPHVELDGLFHGPGWTHPDDDEFRRRVAAALGDGGWVVDGNYRSHLGELVVAAADTVLWLDPPRRTALQRVVRRTLRRVVTRQVLWNGNREAWSNLWSRVPERSIIAWTWTRHGSTRARYEAESAGDDRWVRLRSPADVRRWLSRLAGCA